MGIHVWQGGPGEALPVEPLGPELVADVCPDGRGSRTVQELRVVGVRVELPGNQPILLLKETQGERYLPIWIGAVEAAAIAFEQQGVRPARPMTHDLLREVVRTLGAELEAVNITEARPAVTQAGSSTLSDWARARARAKASWAAS